MWIGVFIFMGILLYRKPNQNILHQQEGSFSAGLMEGAFVVSDLRLDNIWSFTTNGVSTETVRWNIEAQGEEEYLSMIDLAIKALDGPFTKVVLSRIKQVEVEESYALLRHFHVLCQRHPQALVYFFQDEVLGTWLGATPEVLLEVGEGRLRTYSLAGTINVDEEWGEKESNEQSIVTEYIIDQLSEYGEVRIEDRNDLRAGSVKHLLNEITIHDFDATKTESVLHKLHPTPAVAGMPQRAALDLIERLEPHHRGLYTGVIGTYNPSSQTELFVNLRCAQFAGTHLLYYVGGGITRQSRPEDEWRETELKAKSVMI